MKEVKRDSHGQHNHKTPCLWRVSLWEETASVLHQCGPDPKTQSGSEPRVLYHILRRQTFG